MPRLHVCTLRYALLASFLALTAAALRAGPPTWAGGGSDNKASNASNWASGNTTLTSAPGNSDQVVISTGSVLFDTNISYGALTFSGGNINGSSTLTIGSLASSAWSGGNMTFSSGGGVAVGNGATFAISGASTDHDFNATALTNNGTVNWSGGTLRSGNGGAFANNGVFNDTASNAVNNAYGGTSLVFNNGSGAQYNKSAVGTTTFSVALNNSGAVNVGSGELYLHGGGSGSGTFTVTGTGNDILIDNGYTFGSGTSLSGLVRFGGGSITANGNITANGLSIEGGSLQGSQTFSGGSISWTGGDWNSTGATTSLASSATLGIGSTAAHDFDGRAITNNGTVNWNAGQLRSGHDGAFVNNANFNDSTATSTDINNAYGGTTSTFTNASGATFAKSGGGTTRFYDVTFNNNGVVNVHAGTLEIHGGGTMASGASISADAGTNVVFSNDYSLADGATLGGSGTYQLTGGTLTASGNITVSSLTQTNGTLGGTQTFKNAAVNWQAGNWNTSTAASTTIASGSSLAIGTTSQHDFNGRAIVNNGTVNWSAGVLRSGNGGSFANNATFNDSTATSTDINNDYGGATSTFTNASGATYSKSGSGTTRFYTVAFNNSGAVNVHSGTLDIHGGGTNSSTGTISADAGTSVVFSNDYTLSDASALSGAGTFSLTGGTLTANGNVNVSNFTISSGTLAGTQSFNGGLSWTGGNLNSSGTTTIGGDTTFTIGNATDHDFNGRAIMNSGIVNWTGGTLRSGNNGTFTNNGTFVDSASNVINSAYGGTVSFNNNAGATYRKTGTGDTNFYVPLVNSGALDIQSGNLVLNTDSTLNDGTTVTGNGALKLLSGTLTANGKMTFSQFQIAGGTVTGNHTFSGSTEWSAGNFNSGNSTTTIDATGTLTVDGSGNHDFSAHNLSNNGTVNWSAGAGPLRSGNAGQFANNGTFNDTASNLWTNDYGGTTAQFLNGTGGIYNKNGAGTTTFNAVSFTNAGTINVQSGALELGGGGSSPTGAHFNAVMGAALRFTSGNFGVADGTGFAGNGSFVIAGATVSIGTTVTVSDFELTAGTLDGNQTFSGGLTWTGGDMNDNGRTTIGAGGTMAINGTGNHDLNGHAFVNNGTVNWSGGPLRSGNGGTLSNNGTFNDSSGSVVNNDYGGTALTFTNSAAGHYVKSGDNTTTYLVAFNNNGEVNVTGGALSLTAGGTIGSGASFHGTGQALLTSGTFTANGTIDSTSLVLNGATVGGTHSFTGAVLWNTGNFNATGMTTIASGATLNVGTSSNHDFNTHNIVNNGTIVWAAGSGPLRAGNGATLVNSGTFNDNASSTINNDYGGTSGLVFTNSLGATYHKLAAGNTDFLVPLTNNGTVAVDAGAIVLHSGGTFGSGATFTGAGTTQLVSGVFIANGGIQTSNLVLAGGTLAGNSVLHGLFEFASGLLDSQATTTVDSDGAMTIDTTANHDLPGSALINNGVIKWNGGTIRGGNASTITNNGTFLDNASSTVNNDYGGTSLAFTNGASGVYAKTGSGTTTFAVPFTNNGTLLVDAGSLVFSTTFTNNGSLIFANGGIAQFANPISFASSGTLAGAGTLNVSSVIAGGLVSPGKSPGQMNVTGDFTLLSTSLLLIELGGTSQGTTYDFLNVGGSATLAGNLSVQFTNGFATSVLPTNTFTILTANGTGGLLGAFANVANGQRLMTTDGLGSFQVNYGAGLNSVTLTNFVAVPEPSTYALFGFGVTSLAFAAWRRKRKA